MLQINQTVNRGYTPATYVPSFGALLEDLIGVVRRQRELFWSILLLGLLVAGAYILSAQPMFTSTAKLVIDTRKVQAFQQQGMSLLGEPQVDAPTVDSQVEIIKSEKIAKAVIEDLNLITDPEFVADDRSLTAIVLGGLKSLLAASAPSSPERRAFGRFADRLDARRVGTTYVIAVSFTSQDGAKSARIANAVVDAYMREQLETKFQTTRQAGKWLQDRLAELRSQALLADRAVQEFKAKNNIVDTPQGLMNEQQLTEINTHLVIARGQTAEARARLQHITEVLKGEISDAAVTDALKSEVINRLRQQYLSISRREADWSTRMPQDHPALLNIRNEMQELQASIRKEMDRIAEAYRSEYDIASAREAALQRNLDQLVRQSVTTNQDRVTLRELESSAQTFRTMADAFQQRYMVAVQQESFPITEARTITEASTGQKSHPRTLLTLGAALVGSTLIGYGACLIRDQLDRVFRTAPQVEGALGVPCLGLVPRVKLSSKVRRSSATRSDPKGTSALLRFVLTAPLSPFAEAIRTIKVGLDLRGLADGKEVLAVTSVLPSEGKTTIAANIAHLAAQNAQRVLLIDCDLHKASLSRLMAPTAQAGLIEVLNGTSSLNKVLCCDSESGLWFLPVAASSRIMHTSLLISSERMLKLLEWARAEYDLVILDLPPLAPLVDAQAISKAVGSFIIVVEWGRSRVDLVKGALASADALSDKIGGVAINNVNVGMMKRYEGLSSTEYGYGEYTRGLA